MNLAWVSLREYDMQIPLQIVFEHMSPSAPIEARIRAEAAELEQFYDRVTGMRVVVGKAQHRHHKGDTYHARIHLTVPGAADVVVSRDPAEDGAHADFNVAIADAFAAARRQLQDIVRERRDQARQG